MLCEGSPLFFYTWWGPVTASGTSHSECRLTRCPAGGPVGVAYSKPTILVAILRFPNSSPRDGG